ncbi:hypothetical protein [Bizionia sp.]|uniref:hypothetical protein n=1 Tax=Bizionia sp. TaxID=1954480 RepID=UPI003A9078DE
MNIVRYIMLIGIILLISSPIHAQIDSSPNTSTSIPAVKNDSGNSGISISPIENNGFSKPNSGKVNGLSVPNNSTLNTDKKQFSMFGEKFGNPGELYEERFKKQEKNFDNIFETDEIGSKTDQYLGDYKTKSSKVRVLYRDHGTIDGDDIRVFVDKDIMMPYALLTSDYRGFVLQLKTGFNVIDFLALTGGAVGANTAQVVIMDENDEIIASSGWWLAKGVKATLIVVKE